MYNSLQKGMSIVSIIRFDITEKILNPYFNNMTIDDSLHPFMQMTVHVDCIDRFLDGFDLYKLKTGKKFEGRVQCKTWFVSE